MLAVDYVKEDICCLPLVIPLYFFVAEQIFLRCKGQVQTYGAYCMLVCNILK